MKKFILAPMLIVLVTLPASAQYGPIGPGRDAQRTVATWYQRFLGRQPDAYAASWIQALQSGQDPNQVLSGILGSDEYFLRKGGTPRGFVVGLYQDVTGRAPTPQEEAFWAGQIYAGSRADIAYSILTRQAPSWDDHPLDHDYRRPYYRFR